MVTIKLTFAVFALIVLFPIYFDAIFFFFFTEAGWTFDFSSYLHFSILLKFNLLFFSILFDTPPKNQLISASSQAFDQSKAPTEPPIDLKKLHAKSGEQALEIDFLEGVLKTLGRFNHKS